MRKELEVLERAIRAAGDEIVRIAAAGYETMLKERRDPVTTADLDANRILKTALLQAFPKDGWLSEETLDDPVRMHKERVWIVDPIDGTKEFVNEVPEYAISVALVERGTPVVSAVCNPATGELFTAARGEGTWLNGARVTATAPLGERPILLASRSEVSRGKFKAFEADAVIRPVGSIAYKLALIAAGRGDMTWSLGPKHEWDIAGGVLLVMEAGGYVADPLGRPFVFNRADTLVRGIVATSGPAESLARTLIAPFTDSLHQD